MANPRTPNIVIEKINLERFSEFYGVVAESSREWFTWGMIPKADLSYDELRCMLRAFLVLWERDETYMFYIMDIDGDQVVGVTFLNRINRIRQFANLGYAVRGSRLNEGIATTSGKLIARYGFEKLGLQRIEIVICPDNLPSLKVAEKLGAQREGVLRNGMRLHGTPCDAFLYSLIPADFGIPDTTRLAANKKDLSQSLNVFFHRILRN
jgi:RimJ/RimL family protein N-acetyltransferase